ncbi:MAG: amidase family protein, partial [Dehalococcoidia bacterium]|nr:amidase family protein [Dehalococcoidia bacterium]
FTGYPAISIPCGKSDGLPVGLMLAAPFFREDLLLRAAYAYQHLVDWASLFPRQVPAGEGP